MPPSGQPGGVYRVPAARDSNALSTPQDRCGHWRKNGACCFGSKCGYQEAKEDNVESEVTRASISNYVSKEKQENGSLQLRATTDNTSTQRSDVSAICRDWQRDGDCRYGQGWRFSHAIQENEEERAKAEGEEKQRKEEAEREKQERERAERERTERERMERERVERERLERERTERERVERERVKKEKEKAEIEKAEREARERRKREREIELAAEEAEKLAQQKQMARRKKEAAVIKQYIVAESNLVTCSAGMNIQHIVSGFDLCRITIKNFPKDAHLDEIAEIFTQRGVDDSEFFVQQIKPKGGECEAVVLAKVNQGQNIAARLEGIKFRNRRLTFEVSENASWNGMSTASQNATFLTVSWVAPSETIIATYDSLEQAHSQVQRLNGEIWNGRRIRVTLDDNTTCYIAPEIKIRGCVPGTALDHEFYAFVETFNVRLLSSASYNLDEVFKNVRGRLSCLPGVRMESYEVLNNGNQLDAEAWIKVEFNDWEDAKHAHAAVDTKRLRSNFPRLRAWLPQPVQYSTEIPRQQYQAQKAQWDELSKRRQDRGTHVHTSIGEAGDVFVRVLGQDKRAARSLKVRVEGMVAGVKLDAAHWHPSFAFPSGKLSFFSRVFNEKKVYVRSDFKAHCLRLYGEPAEVTEAKQMIRVEVERLAERETTVDLAAACVRGFMKEGLGKLKAILGENNVTVNVASWPYKVTVKGGIRSTYLKTLVDWWRAIDAFDRTRPRAERKICPICTGDVSSAEELGCGHTYCSGCLSHVFTSAMDSKHFPIVCVGNGNRCRVPITIPFIRQFLPHQSFKNLVETAFMAYLEKHPLELKYCTTLDCKQIYRRRTNKALLKCPACFSIICPMCDEEAHEGMTCEERKFDLVRVSDGANQRNAGVDEDMLRAAQIRETERFERERRALEGQQQLAWAQKAAKCREEEARAASEARRIGQEEQASEELRVRENQERIARLQAAQATLSEARREPPAERRSVARRIKQEEQASEELRIRENQERIARLQAAQATLSEARREAPAERSVARRIRQEEQASEELRIRENQERIARLQAAQATLSEARREAPAERSVARRIRQEEQASEELRIRENQERIARIQATQAAKAAKAMQAAQAKVEQATLQRWN
ncbi:hypothetical protein BJ912DRAFT_924165 [Pholiota molesta]|nr:hypothetical protein BJ912DRAFT_924165 [Pholiota molesta]